MRFPSRLALVMALTCLGSSLPSETFAQGFFESLFGSGTPSPVAQPRPALPPPLMSPFGYRAPANLPYRPRENSIDDGGSQPDRNGRFRTLCVRMCDGYYYPISFAATRGSFYRDANICRASCGEEARLFFHAAKDPDIGEMVDITGRAYAKLPTAYRYRKAQLEGCKCKPDPWAQSELDRHHRYALDETAEQRRRKEQVIADAGAGSGGKRDDMIPGDDAVVDPAEAMRREIGRPVAEAQPKLKARAGRGEGRSIGLGSPGARPAPAPVRAAGQPAGPAPFGLGGGGLKSRWPGD